MLHYQTLHKLMLNHTHSINPLFLIISPCVTHLSPLLNLTHIKTIQPSIFPPTQNLPPFHPWFKQTILISCIYNHLPHLPHRSTPYSPLPFPHVGSANVLLLYRRIDKHSFAFSFFVCTHTSTARTICTPLSFTNTPHGIRESRRISSPVKHSRYFVLGSSSISPSSPKNPINALQISRRSRTAAWFYSQFLIGNTSETDPEGCDCDFDLAWLSLR